jgi:hypothetical protein
MSKNNLKRKKEILALLCQGLTGVDIRETLGLSQGGLNHTVSWLIDNGYMRRVRRGKYVATGKPWPTPRSGNTELVGRVNDLYILSRPHPHFRYEVDYFAVAIKEDHLEIETVGLGSLLKTMVKYPAAIMLTACTLNNLRAAVGQG